MPAQSVTVSVNFGPTVAGYAAGTLSVSSNAQNSAVQVAISGTGIAAQVGAHSVTLSWTPSTSQVNGYYIYRSTVSGGPYSKLNTTLDPESSYTDSGLASGNYFYVVTSVDPNGVESGYSNEVAVTIP
jgi:fibronectin type 3 domain-containing protein